MADAPPAAPNAPASPGGSPPASVGSPAPPDAGQGTPPAWKPPPLKVYGKQVEVDEATYHRHAQQGAAFAEQQRLIQEGRAERARWEAERANYISLEDLKKDPRGALTKAGYDPRKWAAEHVLSAAEEANLTPEAREAKEAKEERDRLKEEIAAQKQAAEDAEAERVATEQGKALAHAFEAALQKVGVPPGMASWRMVLAMNKWQRDSLALLEAGQITPEEHAQRATPDVMAEVAMAERGAGLDHYLPTTLRGDELLWALGEERARAVGEALVAKLKRERAGQTAGGVPTVGAPVQPAPAAPVPQGNGAHDNRTGQFISRERVEFMRKIGRVAE